MRLSWLLTSLGAFMRMWVLVLVTRVGVLVRRLAIVPGTTFMTGRVPVWVTVHDVTVHVRMLVDEVHAEQQVAVGKQRTDRPDGGRPVIFAENHGAVGEAVKLDQLVSSDDERLASQV